MIISQRSTTIDNISLDIQRGGSADTRLWLAAMAQGEISGYVSTQEAEAAIASAPYVTNRNIKGADLVWPPAPAPKLSDSPRAVRERQERRHARRDGNGNLTPRRNRPHTAPFLDTSAVARKLLALCRETGISTTCGECAAQLADDDGKLMEWADCPNCGARNPRLTPHGCRHNQATRLATNGVDAVTIKSVMGWKSIKMLDRYGHFVKRKGLAAAAQFDDWGSPQRSALSRHNREQLREQYAPTTGAEEAVSEARRRAEGQDPDEIPF